MLKLGISRVALLAFVALLTGCPGSSSPSAPATGQVAAPAFVDEPAILHADATKLETQTALASLATDRAEAQSRRLAALRRLEEQAPSVAVATAEKLALDTSPNATAAFLRENSVALLCRSKAPEAPAALDRVKKSSLDLAVLAARLSGKEGK